MLELAIAGGIVIGVVALVTATICILGVLGITVGTGFGIYKFFQNNPSEEIPFRILAHVKQNIHNNLNGLTWKNVCYRLFDN